MKRICGRDITAGPGSCYFWWDNDCPKSVRHCFSRFIRENGGEISLDQATAWAGGRDKDREPQPSLELSKGKKA